MIELNDISFSYYQDDVLNHFSLNIKEGESIAICGDNGSGKSTLLKLINGLIFSKTGYYKFDGVEITEKQMEISEYSKEFHQRIGFVWQNPDTQLFCSSVEEELAFGPVQMGLPEDEIHKRVNDTLELLDLTKLRNRPPYYLSGGEKKKTAIASILTMNPSVWTLDEPLSSLDKKTREWLIEFLQALKKAGKTIIFSSHESSLVEVLADRTCFIR
ncbi:MAG: ABC transporter ATP-binding protein [Candidatus Riflebacteria bacterium]|nr:ABC transporter ATP-binding protein [Candidatus Riflebacteria bacterium]